MPKSIYRIASRDDLTLQQVSDSADDLAESFQIERYQIIYKAHSSPVLNIDIYNDVNDYATYWKGPVFAKTLVSAAAELHRKVSERSGAMTISAPVSVTASIFLPSGSKDEVLSLPSAESYLDQLAEQGMTFLRLEMPYYDVWADLVQPPGMKRGEPGETGWTSFYNISDEIATFFFLTTDRANMALTQDSMNITRLAELLSITLQRFERI